MKEEKDGPLVAVDCNILVWGIREQGPSDKLQRARWLFKKLEMDSSQILIPSVVLSEYLTPVNPKDHKDTIAALTRRFNVAPFDVSCTGLAAQLFSDGRSERDMGACDARKCLRADCLIIATAKMHGAQVLYSNDAKFRNLAKKVTGLTVEDLPTIAPNLFADVDC